MTRHHPKWEPGPPVAAVATPNRMPAGNDTEERSRHGGVTFKEAVQERAYQLWERAGHPAGNDVSFWLEAEAELSALR